MKLSISIMHRALCALLALPSAAPFQHHRTARHHLPRQNVFSGIVEEMGTVVSLQTDKEMLLCEVCGEALAPADQLRWLVRRMGPLAFTNPTLMLMAGRDLRVVEEPVKSEGDDVQRADRLRIQCPKCRRQTALQA